MKHKYYVFIYPINVDPIPQKNGDKGCIRVVEKIMPLKYWAKANNRKLYIQKVY